MAPGMGMCVQKKVGVAACGGGVQKAWREGCGAKRRGFDFMDFMVLFTFF